MNKTNQTEERQIIETVLSYCENGIPDVMKIPVEEYTDPDWLSSEIDIFFRQFPITSAVSSVRFSFNKQFDWKKYLLDWPSPEIPALAAATMQRSRYAAHVHRIPKVSLFSNHL